MARRSIEIAYLPHPLNPPLLQRRGGNIGFEGDGVIRIFEGELK